MSALHELMRGAVRSGAAHAASLGGAQVYGQVGMVHTGSGWMSWFVGYRGDIAIAAIESGQTPQLSAAALAGAFFSAAAPLSFLVPGAATASRRARDPAAGRESRLASGCCECTVRYGGDGLAVLAGQLNRG